MLSPMLRLQEGKNYLAAMSCAANYAWVNRSSMTFLVRQAFQKMFKQQADDLDMHVVYDVSHNIAKVCVWSSDPFVSAPPVCCVRLPCKHEGSGGLQSTPCDAGCLAQCCMEC